MKKFKSSIFENDEKIAPEYIEEVLRNYYGYAHSYTLDENNNVNLLTNIDFDNIENKRLLFQINSAKRVYFKRCGIMSTFGFPLESIELNLNSCDNIRILDFSSLDTETIRCYYCSSLKIIKNINIENLLEISLIDLPVLKKLEVEKSHFGVDVTIDRCNSLDFKNVVIKNRISRVNIYSCESFKDFVDFNIDVKRLNAECDFLKSFDGFDVVNIEKTTLTNVPIIVKSLSKLIESKTIISHIDFASSYDAKNVLLDKIVSKYATKRDKIDHIMDFTIELIDNSFEDQV